MSHTARDFFISAGLEAVVELVDTLVSKTSSSYGVRVRTPPALPRAVVVVYKWTTGAQTIQRTPFLNGWGFFGSSYGLAAYAAMTIIPDWNNYNSSISFLCQ